MRRSCSERSRKSLLTSARTTQRFSAARPAATVTWWTITITPVHNVRKGVGRAPGLGGVPASINASLASAAACCLPTRPAKWTRTTDTYSNGPKEEAAALKCSRLADKRSATPCVELRAGTARLLRVAGDVLSPAPTNSTITPTTVIVNSGAAIGSVSQFSYAVRRRLMQPPHSCPDRHLLVTRICSCASTGASSASRTSSLGHTACQPMDPQARPHICEARYHGPVAARFAKPCQAPRRARAADDREQVRQHASHLSAATNRPRASSDARTQAQSAAFPYRCSRRECPKAR